MYARTLVRVLRPLSMRDSVWYGCYPAQDLDAFLQTQRRAQPMPETAIAVPVAAPSSR